MQHCPDCTISLTVHQTPATLRCHYCGHEEAVPSECPECGGAVQRMRGVGTQQLERLVAERFPEARIGRMDLDTTSTKWSHQRILEAVHSEVLQDLFAAALELDRALADATPPGAARVDAAREAVGRAMKTLREVVRL